MKHIFLAALFFIASISSAAESDKYKHCVARSRVYVRVATLRDAGFSPQEAWAKFISADAAFPGTSKDERKAIANQIYFDPDYDRAGGDAFFEQVVRRCMESPNKWTPLK